MRETVLVVDDEDDIRSLIRFTLEDEGFEVVEAANGEQALALTAERQLDVVLLDAMMPVMDGRETCRRLKANEATRALTVVFLSARAETWMVDGSCGSAGCLMKPFDVDTLASDLRAILEGISR